jgi:hypothetical protein
MQKKKSTGPTTQPTTTVGPHCVSLAQDQIKSKFASQESTESSHHSIASQSSSGKSNEKSSEERKTKAEDGKEGDVGQKCKDRLAQFRKTIIKDMVLND